MTRSTLLAFCSSLALGACADPEDTAPPSTGYRVALVVEDDDELELTLVDVDAAGVVREIALDLDVELSSMDSVKTLVSPDGRWLLASGAHDGDAFDSRLFDLDASTETDRLEGERLPPAGVLAAKAFSADSSVLALETDEGVQLVALHDPDHDLGERLEVDSAGIHRIHARPGSAELLLETSDSLWWHRGTPDETRTRELVHPFVDEGSDPPPFLDASTIAYRVGDGWAFANVVDGVLVNVEEVDIVDDEDRTEACERFVPLAKDGRVGAYCGTDDAAYWIDATAVEDHWRVLDTPTDDAVGLSAGGTHLVLETDDSTLVVADLAARDEAVEIAEIDQLQAIVTCFGETYVIAEPDLHRIDGLDGDDPTLVQTGAFGGSIGDEWHCMPGEGALVLTTRAGVYVVRATEPDVLHEIEPGGNGYGAADAAHFVYRSDDGLMELTVATGEIRPLLDAAILEADIVAR